LTYPPEKRKKPVKSFFLGKIKQMFCFSEKRIYLKETKKQRKKFGEDIFGGKGGVIVKD